MDMTRKLLGITRLVFGGSVQTRDDCEQEGIRWEPHAYTDKTDKTVVRVARVEKPNGAHAKARARVKWALHRYWSEKYALLDSGRSLRCDMFS